MWVSINKHFMRFVRVNNLIARPNIAIPKDELTGSTQRLGKAFGRNQTVSTYHLIGQLPFQPFRRP